MNRHFIIVTVLATILTFNLRAQTALTFPKSAYIEPYRLEVTLNKTTNLVFPAAITSVDRCSQDIVVQKAEGVENILKIKAAVKSFEETNLSVITGDGLLYSFLVTYHPAPAYLTVNVARITSPNTVQAPLRSTVAVTQPAAGSTVLAAYTGRVVSMKSNIHSVYDEAGKASAELTGLYVKDNVLFCRLALQNQSRINYDIEQFRFSIRDLKQSKRTASQEIEINPLLITGDSAVIRGKSKQIVVVALPKFTIPDGKYFAVQLMERNGGRHLALRVRNRHIMKARVL